VSKPLSIALIALVWIVAAGLCALPSLWPPYAHFLSLEQWPLGALTGWVARGAVIRLRRSRQQEISGDRKLAAA
jgi:hypothetical protein